MQVGGGPAERFNLHKWGAHAGEKRVYADCSRSRRAFQLAQVGRARRREASLCSSGAFPQRVPIWSSRARTWARSEFMQIEGDPAERSN